MTQNSETIPQFRIKHEFLKNSFFAFTEKEWNKLNPNIRNSERALIFSKAIF